MHRITRFGVSKPAASVHAIVTMAILGVFRTCIADSFVDDRGKVALLGYGARGDQFHEPEAHTLGAAPQSRAQVLGCLRGCDAWSSRSTYDHWCK